MVAGERGTAIYEALFSNIEDLTLQCFTAGQAGC